MKYRGSCLCGKMKYETGDLVKEIDHCHCRFCQKQHGAPFGSLVLVKDPSTFTWTSGGDDVGSYESSPDSWRQFCNTCGSKLVAIIHGGKLIAITPSTLDDKLEVEEIRHMFVSSKADWYTIREGETAYDEYPPYLSDFFTRID